MAGLRGGAEGSSPIPACASPEPFLLPLPCSLPYTLRLPVLCPARVRLNRVPLGPRPWLHLLRSRLPGLVRRLRRYYGGVRLLPPVHHWLRLLAFPMRTSPVLRLARRGISRFPDKKRTCIPGSKTTSGRRSTRGIALRRIAFRMYKCVGTRDDVLSWLNGWPTRPPPCQRLTASLTTHGA